MVRQKEAEEWVCSLIEQRFGVKKEEIRPGWSLIDDLGADSEAVYEFRHQLEKKTRAMLPDTDVNPLDTVADAVRLIRDHLEEGVVYG